MIVCALYVTFLLCLLQHLLVSERVHRDLIQSQSVKAMAALRIQCAFRSFKTRRLFENLREHALSNVRRQSLTQLQSLLLGLQLEKCNLEADPAGTTSELAEM